MKPTLKQIIIERVVTTPFKKENYDETAVFFFEHLIDMYELYLSNEIKAADCEVLKNLTDLAGQKKTGAMKELQTIKGLQRMIRPPHPVSVAMEKMGDTRGKTH